MMKTFQLLRGRTGNFSVQFKSKKKKDIYWTRVEVNFILQFKFKWTGEQFHVLISFEFEI
jgi:hypothetical protein